MSTNEARRLIDELGQAAQRSHEIAKTAKRGGKSLAGDNPYGRRFQATTIELSVAETGLRPLLEAAGLLAAELARFDELLVILKNFRTTPASRAKAVRDFQFFSQTVLNQKTDGFVTDSVPKTERILPMDVVRGSGTYYEKLIQQANGSYEHGWYDATLVMIRKFFESLIIAVYEIHGKAAEIKGKDNEFFLLRQLVDKVIGETADWNLGRETKPALREIREDGNRSAHTRRYNAVKADIDRLVKGIRVAAEELLHLAKLK